MIFAELYLRRTLELFFNSEMVQEKFKFLKSGGIAFFWFFFVVIRRNSSRKAPGTLELC